MGMSAQSTRNSGNASPGRLGAGLSGFEWRRRHSATEVWMPSTSARTAMTVHGITRQQHHHEVVPEGLLVLVAVGGKAFQIVFEKELAEEGGVLVLHGNEPGQHHGEVEHHARPPERAPKDATTRGAEARKPAMMSMARNGATGPLASVATPVKK